MLRGAAEHLTGIGEPGQEVRKVGGSGARAGPGCVRRRVVVELCSVLHFRSTTLLVTRVAGFYNPPNAASEAMKRSLRIRVQPPSRRVVHFTQECLNSISLYVSPRSNE